MHAIVERFASITWCWCVVEATTGECWGHGRRVGTGSARPVEVSVGGARSWFTKSMRGYDFFCSVLSAQSVVKIRV